MPIDGFKLQKSFKLLDAEAATADVVSDILLIPINCHRCSLQFYLANTDAVGTLKVQESNLGANGDALSDAQWKDVTFDDGTSSISVSSGTDVNEIRNIQTYCRHLRVIYDFTSGTDSGNELTVFYNAKMD